MYSVSTVCDPGPGDIVTTISLRVPATVIESVPEGCRSSWVPEVVSSARVGECSMLVESMQDSLLELLVALAEEFVHIEYSTLERLMDYAASIGAPDQQDFGNCLGCMVDTWQGCTLACGEASATDMDSVYQPEHSLAGCSLCTLARLEVGHCCRVLSQKRRLS